MLKAIKKKRWKMLIKKWFPLNKHINEYDTVSGQWALCLLWVNEIKK